MNSAPLHNTNKKALVIAVDLTPLHPGGESGGAKIVTLELLQHLAAITPESRFILLTHADTHAELADLERANIQRLQITQPFMQRNTRLQLKKLLTKLLQQLPPRLGLQLKNWLYKLRAMLRQTQLKNPLISQLKPDLLFYPFSSTTSFDTSIPSVYIMHDLQYKTYPQFFTNSDIYLRDHAFQVACKHATALVAVSNYTRSKVIQHGQIDPDRISTIYTRIAQRIYKLAANASEILNKFNLNAGRYFIYPANFWEHKNHEMLFSAFASACQQGLAADLKLVCTGAPGPRLEYLSAVAHSMQLDDRLVFTGFVAETELSVLMHNSLGMLFPSLYEGFGLPVIEAMAAGIPVACSNITSLPEIAANAAIFFDPRIQTQIVAAIFSLVNQKTTDQQLIQVGKQRAAEFTNTMQMAQEYWELMQTVANKKKWYNHNMLQNGIDPQ